MKINMLDALGFYVVDFIIGESGDVLPENWTADLVGNGYYKAQYQMANKDAETGEWSNGVWIETSGPSPEDIESQRELLIIAANFEKISLMSHASDMIGALSDEIEGLEDGGDDVPDKLRADLKAWKQYRVKVKNIDVSFTPDIEWPVVPSAVSTEV
ncbi:tail fiber assembly protein [Yersinia intermedia]|uniref:tail fiber assembly protein n=1 Tax=Yersinia intermedia TaxID=631 RepID=UPI0005E8EF4F|nr:tail fiber assembly protein [Yersinia intermedia]CNE45711.1 putative phage tail fiber assembly protein [Yersinia intermedia]CNH55026.1 putative phage tail fiber assembly protein [Yersinia intermedia]CNK19196.1 putative phage tail fiber assembly protein [Yersinia intermedia]